MSKSKSLLNPEIGPLPFCPGCGHDVIVKALDKALVKRGVDPSKVVLVTDIGCIGLTCRHFVTSAFHGLHGRAITYACGIKLARPDLDVVAIMGDGACGIGGTHLLNVARRNIGITLLVANNFNYGMTGGQHSVTTPTDGLTSTTPWGNVEGPMDLCATSAAAGAAWVSRASSFDKDLDDTIVKAIEQPGFSMVEIWELCTAYYTPRNEMKKKELFAMAERHGFTFGLQTDKPRPEYIVGYRAGYESAKGKAKVKPPIEAEHSSSLKKQTGILIAGSAGQKIKSTATIFGEGALYAGLQVTQKDDYPITVQTGHSVAEILLSPEPIEYTGIENPEHVLIVSEDGLRRIRAKVEKLPESSTILADEQLDLPQTKAKVVRIPIAKAVKTISKLSAVTAGLGALLAHLDLYPIEAFSTAIRKGQREKIAAINEQALRAGAELMKSK